MRLNRMNALATCRHFSIFIGSFLYQGAKPPRGIVLFINLLGKGLIPRACMGDAGSISWFPGKVKVLRDFHVKATIASATNFSNDDFIYF